MVADYATGTASAYVNGVLGLSGYALRGGVDPNADFSEIFMYVNGESDGNGNVVAVDNIVAYDYNAVPEPATIIIWSLLGAGSWLGMRVWRQKNGPAGREPWSPEARQAIHAIIARGNHQ